MKFEKFMLCCNKILPTIYDNSLSYYETICKMAYILNTLGDDLEKMSDDFEELENYVKNYFKNLDLNEEVKKNLEELGEEGKIQGYLNPFLLKDKNIVFFGDSLLWGDNGLDGHNAVDYPVPKRIAQWTGANVKNYAKKSATASNYLDTNNNTLQNQLLTWTNPSDADYVFLEFGTNDFTRGVPIGSVEISEWNSYAGAINSAIDYITAQSPKATIFLIGTPPGWRAFLNAKNNYSIMIKSYNLALGKIAKNRKVKFIDWLKSGIDTVNLDQFSPDQTHFNQDGYDKLAMCILQNFGGNEFEEDVAKNEWNHMLYPNTDAEGSYAIVRDMANTTYRSFGNVKLGKGIYRFKFEYNLTCNAFDTKEYRIGIHFKIGDEYVISPIGLVNGVGKIDMYTRVDEILEGKLTIRPTINNEDIEIENLTIKNLEIIPIEEGEVYNTYRLTADSTVTNYFSGEVKVARCKDGLIRVAGVGVAMEDIISGSVIFENTMLRRVNNIPTTDYFALFSGTAVRRGKCASGEISFAGETIPKGSSISFSFTI